MKQKNKNKKWGLLTAAVILALGSAVVSQQAFAATGAPAQVQKTGPNGRVDFGLTAGQINSLTDAKPSEDEFYDEQVAINQSSAFGFQNLIKYYPSALGVKDHDSGGSTAIGTQNRLFYSNNSTAVGYSNWGQGVENSLFGSSNRLLSGSESTVVGTKNTLYGDLSMVAGTGNEVTQVNGKNVSGAFVVGTLNEMSQTNAIIVGFQNKVLSTGSSIVTGASAFGVKNYATGANAVAIGFMSAATRTSAYALGTGFSVTQGQLDGSNDGTETIAGNSTNRNLASGENSLAVGWANNATGEASIAIGSAVANTEVTTELVSPDKKGVYKLTNKDGRTENLQQKATAQGSIALGIANQATAKSAVAIGDSNVASGQNALAIGGYLGESKNYKTGEDAVANTAAGRSSIALGLSNYSSGTNAVSIGTANKAKGEGAISIGSGEATATEVKTKQQALGDYAQTIGAQNTASGNYTMAYGYKNTADQTNSIAIGTENTASSTYSQAIGGSNAVIGNRSIAYGYSNAVYGESEGSQTAVNDAIAIGSYNEAQAQESVAIGSKNIASGTRSLAIGGVSTLSSDVQTNTASGAGSMVVGLSNASLGKYSISVGTLNTANSDYSQAIGASNTVTGLNSLAYGYSNTTSEQNAVAIGSYNTASQWNSIAIGSGTVSTHQTASGMYSIALGYSNSAEQYFAQSIGSGNKTLASYAQGIGYGNEVNAVRSIAYGAKNTIRGADDETAADPAKNAVAIGTNNKVSALGAIAIGSGKVTESGDYLFTVGTPQTASGQYSVALGGQNTVSTNYSVSVGYQNVAKYDDRDDSDETGATDGTANSWAAIAMGAGNIASGKNAISIGAGNYENGEWTKQTAQGVNAIAIGNINHATESSSFAIGTANTASAENALSLGGQNMTNAYASMAFGLANNVYGDGDKKETSTIQGSMAQGMNNEVFGANSIAMGASNYIGGTRVTDENNKDTFVKGKQSDVTLAFGVRNTAAIGTTDLLATAKKALDNNVTDFKSISQLVQLYATGKYAEEFKGWVKKIEENNEFTFELNNEKYPTNTPAEKMATVKTIIEYLETSIPGQAEIIKAATSWDGHGMLIGENNTVYGTRSLGFGTDNKVHSIGSIVIGGGNTVGTETTDDNARDFMSMAIGTKNTIEGSLNVAMGIGNESYGTQTVSVGLNQIGEKDSVVTAGLAYGLNNKVYSNKSVAIGGTNEVNAQEGIGTDLSNPTQTTTIKAGESLAFGLGNTVNTSQAIVIGGGNTVGASADTAVTVGANDAVTLSGREVVIGVGSNIGQNAGQSTALGGANTVSAANSVALGFGAQVSALNAQALGAGANAKGLNSVALGAGSETTVNEVNVVSVGTSNSTRKVVNVTYGTSNHDAATWGQIAALHIDDGTEGGSGQELVELNAKGNKVDLLTNDGSVITTFSLKTGEIKADDDGIVSGGDIYNYIKNYNFSGIVDYDTNYLASKKHWLSTDFNLDIDDSTKGKESTAYGYGAKATGDNSVALGSNSIATAENTVSFGHTADDINPATGNKYGTSLTRKLTNVTAGVENTDAANVGQLLGSGTYDADAGTITFENKTGGTSFVVDGIYMPKESEILKTGQTVSLENTTVPGAGEDDKRTNVLRAKDNSILATFEKGSVATGDTGFVSGGDVYSAIAAKGQTINSSTNVIKANDNSALATFQFATPGNVNKEGDKIIDEKTLVDYGDTIINENTIVDFDKTARKTADNKGNHWLSTDFGISIDDSTKGKDSAAYGYGAYASGDNSVALGSNSIATDANTVSFGHTKDDINPATGDAYGSALNRKLTNVAYGGSKNDAAAYGQIAAANQMLYATTAARTDDTSKKQNVIYANDGTSLATLQIGTVSSGSTGFVSGGQVFNSLVRNTTYVADSNGVVTVQTNEQDENGNYKTAFTIKTGTPGPGPVSTVYTGSDTIEVDNENYTISAKTTGTITEGGKELVTAGTLYNEDRKAIVEEPVTNHISDQSVGDNLVALDKAIGKVSEGSPANTDPNKKTYNTISSDNNISENLEAIDDALKETDGLITLSQDKTQILVGSGDNAQYATSVSFADKDGNKRKLTNVSAGTESGDVAVYDQIAAKNQTISGSNNKIMANDGTTVLATIKTANPTAPVKNGDSYITENYFYTNIEEAVEANTIVDFDKTAKEKVDNSGKHWLSTDFGISIDDGTKGKDSAAYGYGAYAKGDNSVALGSNSIATAENTVSFGHTKDDINPATGAVYGSALNRTLTNVAAGTANTDAANVGQLLKGGTYDAETGTITFQNNEDGDAFTVTGIYGGNIDDSMIVKKNQIVSLADTTVPAEGEDDKRTNVIRAKDNSVLATFTAGSVSEGNTGFVSGGDVWSSIAAEGQTINGANNQIKANDKTVLATIAAATDPTDPATGKDSFTTKEYVDKVITDHTGTTLAEDQHISFADTTEGSATQTNVIRDADGKTLVTIDKGAVEKDNHNLVDGGTVYSAIAKKDQTIDGTNNKIMANDGTTVLATIKTYDPTKPDTDPANINSYVTIENISNIIEENTIVDFDKAAKNNPDGDHWLSTDFGETFGSKGKDSTAYGYGANAQGDNSVAIGSGSIATEDNTFSVGGGTEATNRRIVNVAAGTANTDAANVGQLLNSGTYDSKAGTITFSNKDGDVAFTVEGIGSGSGDVDDSELVMKNQTVSLADTTVPAEGEEDTRTNVLRAKDNSVLATFEKGSVDTDSTGFVSGGDVYAAIAKKNQEIDGENNKIMANDGTTVLATIKVAQNPLNPDDPDDPDAPDDPEGNTFITKNYYKTTLKNYFEENSIVDFDKKAKNNPDGDHWLSTDFGTDGVEHGKDSTAYGYGANAKGDESVAIGKDAVAEGKGSIAIGEGSVAKEDNVVSFGTEDNKRKLTNVAEGEKLGDVAVYDQIAAKNQTLSGTNNQLMANDGTTVLATIKTYDSSKTDRENKDAFVTYDTIKDTVDHTVAPGQVVIFDNTTDGNPGQTNVIRGEDGKVLVTIKKGEVAKGDTGLVSGGDVYNADVAKNQLIYATTDARTDDTSKQQNIIYDNLGREVATMQIGTVTEGSKGFVSGGQVFDADVQNYTYEVEYEKVNEDPNDKAAVGTVKVLNNKGETAFTITGIQTEIGEDLKPYKPYTGDEKTITIDDNKVISAKTTDQITEGAGALVTAGTIYKEDREAIVNTPSTNHISNQSVGDNLVALDKALGKISEGSPDNTDPDKKTYYTISSEDSISENIEKIDAALKETDGLIKLSEDGKQILVGSGDNAAYATTVSFANNMGEARRLTDVAAGVDNTDAANVGQLLGGGTYNSENKTITFTNKEGDTAFTIEGIGGASESELVKNGQTVSLKNTTGSDAEKTNVLRAQDGSVLATFEKGEVEKDNTGFVSGGDVYAAIAKKDQTIDGKNNQIVSNDGTVLATIKTYDPTKSAEENANSFITIENIDQSVTTIVNENSIVDFDKNAKNNPEGDHWVSTDFGTEGVEHGKDSTAYGYGSNAKGDISTAIGYKNTVEKESSTAVGANNTVSGQHSIAAGCDNDVQGDYAVALGHNNKVTGNNAIVIGKDGTAGKDGIVIGNNSSAKEGSTAIGNDSVAKDSNEVSIGHSKGDTYTDPDSGETKTYDSDLNRKITHVADGTSDHDAANVGQVNKVGERVTEVEKKVDGFDSRISDVETSSGRGIAGASALAALHPLEFDPDDKASFAVGYGHFKSSDALALGAFYRPNESVLFSLGGVLGNGEDQFNAGISFALGRDDERTHPMGRVEMSRRIQSLQQENAGLTDRIDRLERFIVQMVQNGQQQKPEEAAQPIPTV